MENELTKRVRGQKSIRIGTDKKIKRETIKIPFYKFVEMAMEQLTISRKRDFGNPVMMKQYYGDSDHEMYELPDYVEIPLLSFPKI